LKTKKRGIVCAMALDTII